MSTSPAPPGGDSSTPELSASSAASTVAPTAASAAPAASVAWEGTYKSTVGSLYIPAELKVRWKPAENTTGLGEGSIAISVDSATGRMRGSLDGPLGPAWIQGYLSEGKLAGTIVRSDPSDHGFTGTLEGEVSGGRAKGALHVTLSQASAIRTASFELSPATAPRPEVR
jgi:hypothetical protein